MNCTKKGLKMIKNKGKRVKCQYINFRLTPEERALVEARIKLTGLSKSEYYLKTFMEQQINITVGKYQSDRLSLEFKRLRESIMDVDMDNGNEAYQLLLECKSLLTELKSVVEDKTSFDLQKGDFEAK